MNRFLLICLLSFLAFSCADTISQEEANKDITIILDEAEQAVLTYQGIEIDSMIELRMEYFHKAKTMNDSVHIYRAHYYLGEFYQSRGIYNDAMSEYEKALQNISDDADSARYIQTKLAIATTEIELGNKYKAGQILLDTYGVAQRNKRTSQLIHINGNMEILGLELENYAEVKKIFKEAITTIEEKKLIEKDSINYVENYINYHMFIAKAYQAEKKLDSALFYIDKGIIIADYYNDVEGKAYLFELKGKTYTAKELFPEAYENLIKAKEIFEVLENDIQISKIMYLLANYHVQKTEYTEALSFLNDLEIRYQENKMLITDCHDVLLLQANIYKSSKQFEKESIYRQKSTDLNASILANGNKETVLQTATKYEIEKIKNKFQAQQQKDKKRFYIFLCIAIAVIGIFGFLLYKQFTKKKVVVVAEEKIIPKPAPQNAIKSDKTVDEILQKLKNLETHEFYLNPKYNLYATAKKIDTNTTYLSSILNTQKKMTFTEYLNNLRIQYTLDRLENDKKFRMYTIKAIAKEVGYRSHGSFSRAFKSKTGENPSTFLKKIR
ncbi:hypothetical protein IMCC3317_06280 [Kordia antarctica]|uniref:HTH araC/xylS-type domain-containing protein n=1 Tax=Kordia antarctica TaxID=1218801 RepID=A0A7L4ZEY3_9FLAO|nr:AraC family transcriptional regulator [Kordia antarctica]QHI35282.1 hypothetical protein IMCC3317_06280 [Kordia antarctica]